MISEAYIWIWLQGEDDPVICGRLEADRNGYSFIYGRSYLGRSGAIALDPRELPLQQEIFYPSFGETHSVIRDAAPDAWGRRVLAYRSGGRPLSELDYLVQAGQSTNQAMIVGKYGRESSIRNALSQTEAFGLTHSEAKAIQEELREVIEEKWADAAEIAGLSSHESKLLKQATILSPACFY